jgi:uncharacterized SAM-binding protein YcdF (DUF218 family)
MKQPRSHRRRRWVVGILLVVAVFVAATARLFIWPDLAPTPRHVDAIIELGGAAQDRRDRLALELAREHRADFLVQSTTTQEAGTNTCLPAVPRVTILCFHADPNTTRGEARYIAAEAARRDWRSVILVTTPDQAWRARLRTTRCFAGEVYVATTPLPPLSWIWQIPYQWAATVKALTVEGSC